MQTAVVLVVSSIFEQWWAIVSCQFCVKSGESADQTILSANPMFFPSLLSSVKQILCGDNFFYYVPSSILAIIIIIIMFTVTNIFDYAWNITLSQQHSILSPQRAQKLSQYFFGPVFKKAHCSLSLCFYPIFFSVYTLLFF